MTFDTLGQSSLGENLGKEKSRKLSSSEKFG